MTIDELVELAESLGLDDESLGNEVSDAADSAAELARETAMEQGIRGQIEYLISEGMYGKERLAEIIREIALEPKEDS